ncbi:hypothetical protein JKP76_03560 [Blastococcus sp. TML/C7B]|uniref:hypothetical protein n=1 Tax=Blastococcus sp. TML/C7B TaxID=2798728 RepID=UPI00190AC1C4|nr:hypothetical protein [Blastococcus sp. TML/C7B]MBN1095194.1 hypothetical protein [Blastococcus sp. TML/C7B]
MGRLAARNGQASTSVQVQIGSSETLLMTGQVTPVTAQDTAEAALMAGSEPVLTRAAAALGDGQPWRYYAERVNAAPESTSHVVMIQAAARGGAEARRIAEAVGVALSDTASEQIASTAATLPSLDPEGVDSGLSIRAQLLQGTVQPFRVIGTTEAIKTSPTAQLPIALGIAGLALGVLLVIGLATIRPTVSRVRDAQRLTMLPAVGFARRTGGADSARLARQLFDNELDGDVVVCPVESDAEKSALDVADWFRAQSRDEDEAARVVTVSDPVAAVVGRRPADGVAALVLVAPVGTYRTTLSDAVDLLAGWRSADAVVIPT